MKLKKVLADQLFNTAAANQSGRRVGKGNIALSIETVDGFTDGVKNAGLIAFKLAVALLKGPFKADHPGMGADPGDDFLGLERL